MRANPYSVELPAATNPDSTPINYTLAGLPAGTGMEFAADTRILSGTPTADAVAAGGGVLTYTATDATALSVEQTFLLAFGEFDMDVDESGTVDNRDSILVARYLLGVTGAALTFRPDRRRDGRCRRQSCRRQSRRVRTFGCGRRQRHRRR